MIYRSLINQKMKKNKVLYYSLITAILLSLGSIKPVFAKEESPKTIREEVKATIQQKTMDLKKTNATREIDRRIASLNSLITKINGVTRITAEQKTSLVAQVQTEIDNLGALKDKIAADTDATVLKADKQQIVLTYRIYALFLPKINLISHADEIQNLADAMKIKAANNPDALAKITIASNKTAEAISTVMVLTPDGYPGNRTDLSRANVMLKDARQALSDARLLMRKATTK